MTPTKRSTGTSSHPSLPVIGSYRIIRQIAEGGFGRIFLGEHLLLEEYACLKQNKKDNEEDAELLKMEAKLLWTLSDYHSIPSTKEFLEIAPNNCVLVMDYIQGETLDELVAKHGRMHPEDACWITERLLGALYFCHDHGVIHSDVKPENVFVEEKKRDIKLIDFGLAAYRPTSKTRPIGYTEKYGAPELVNGRPPIPETDIYGAGIVLLHALGGDARKKAFPADTPPDLVAYCNRLLCYDPSERPSWERDNPLIGLSDLRMHVFGRRHRSG